MLAKARLLLPFTIAALICGSSNARNPLCPAAFRTALALSAERTFLESYVKIDDGYFPGQCGRNVKELMLAMRANGVAIGGAKALMLLGERRVGLSGAPALTTLRPRFNRGAAQDFVYHVILEWTDPETGAPLIFDLDGPAEAVPIDDYFALNFPSGGRGDRLDAIDLRVIDSETYLKAFEDYRRRSDPRVGMVDDAWVVGRFRARDLPGYPVETARDYLRRLRQP